MSKKEQNKDSEKLKNKDLEEASDIQATTENEVVDEKDNLSGELSDLQKKYDELNDSYLRLHAEFDNYRKRTIKEKTDIIKSSGERVLSAFIPLVDDLERAISSVKDAEDKEAVVKGVELIFEKFIAFLKQQGVKEVEATGELFDAERFEAITTVPVDDESKKGHVIDCLQKGYELNGKIIRFPKVTVGE